MYILHVTTYNYYMHVLHVTTHNYCMCVLHVTTHNYYVCVLHVTTYKYCVQGAHVNEMFTPSLSGLYDSKQFLLKPVHIFNKKRGYI